MKTGQNQSEIAIALGVDKSTISQELGRNRGHRPEQANNLAKARCRKKIKSQISEKTWLLVEAQLCLDWSPEEISGWLVKNDRNRVSHEHIYQHVYADQKNGMFSSASSANVYFAHPYSAWERGTNENTNGLIQQYLPKHRDLSTLTAKEELMIMDRLNLRPRKCFNFSTSFDVFFGLHLVALTT